MHAVSHRFGVTVMLLSTMRSRRVENRIHGIDLQAMDLQQVEILAAAQVLGTLTDGDASNFLGYPR